MKRALKKFALRGLVFMGFGPLIYAIVMLILYLCGTDTTSTGLEIFKGVISTSLLAFLVSGVSIVWQEEKLGIGFAVLIHGTTLYVSYLAMYLINNWIPRNGASIAIFSGIFVGTYLLIWLIIYLIEKNRAKALTKEIKK